MAPNGEIMEVITIQMKQIFALKINLIKIRGH